MLIYIPVSSALYLDHLIALLHGGSFTGKKSTWVTHIN